MAERENEMPMEAVLGGVSSRPAMRLGSRRGVHNYLPSDHPLIFALGDSVALGERVVRQLGLSIAPHEQREFEDGEHKTRPLTVVQARDAYVVDSLVAGEGQSPNDKHCRLLFFSGRRSCGILSRLGTSRSSLKRSGPIEWSQ